MAIGNDQSMLDGMLLHLLATVWVSVREGCGLVRAVRAVRPMLVLDLIACFISVPTPLLGRCQACGPHHAEDHPRHYKTGLH